MNLEDVIKKIKVFYAEHDDLDEMIGDLSDGGYIDHWAKKFCEEDFPQNLELAKDLFRIALEKVSEEDDWAGVVGLVDNIAEDLKDKEWAKEIAIELLKKDIEDAYTLISLLRSATSSNILDDADLTQNILDTLSTKDVEVSHYVEMAQIISENKKDLALAKEFLSKVLELDESDISDKIDVADTLAQECYINDKDEAKKLYKTIEEEAKDLSDYNKLSYSINNYMEDKEFLEYMVVTSKLKLKEADDLFEFACYSNEIVDLAKMIADEEILDDKDSAKEIFNLVLNYKGVTDLLDSARAVKEVYEDSDEDYVSDYMNKAVQIAEEFVDEGYYCDIYNFLNDELEDEDMAQEFRDNYEDNMKSDQEEYGGCDDLFDDENSIDVDDIDFDEFEDERTVIAFCTNTFVNNTMEDMYDDDSNLPEEAYEIVGEKLEEFISEVKDKFEGNIEDKILINIDGKLKEFDTSLINDTIEDFESLYLYMVMTKEIPGDSINALLLNLDEYGFYSMYQNDGDTIIQGYDYGEYDTGYFSDLSRDECYINKFTDETCGEFYQEAQRKLI